MLKILPYCRSSESVKELKTELGDKLKVCNPNKRTIGNSVVINWGNSTLDARNRYSKLINHPIAVKNASNKILAFQKMKDANVSTVEWTQDINVASEWLYNEGCRVVERNNVCGYGGNGINIVNDSVDELNPSCELFTKYVSKRIEFRVHVFYGVVIDYTQKKRRSDTDINNEIRNHNNGWVFCREGVERNESVMNEAIKAVKALQLDFGAVDVILDSNNKVMVLEVNSAPGITGLTTLQYVIALEELGYI